uniref:Uncharacterized protein n=1 Tax=Pipistrellus kuhlii TaxID=59472 RepID=A0A7J7RVZ0_PIPKU|nr:hypothetical protein mPipKuh1_010231 [Pipistrellus kuhlii]
MTKARVCGWVLAVTEGAFAVGDGCMVPGDLEGYREQNKGGCHSVQFRGAWCPRGDLREPARPPAPAWPRPLIPLPAPWSSRAPGWHGDGAQGPTPSPGLARSLPPVLHPNTHVSVESERTSGSPPCSFRPAPGDADGKIGEKGPFPCPCGPGLMVTPRAPGPAPQACGADAHLLCAGFSMKLSF